MLFAGTTISQIGLFIIYVSLPILALYFIYLLIKRAFSYMGFSSLEATIIVFVSFILGAGLIDNFVGFPFSNIYLFPYRNWEIGINTGGAVIPVIISFYLLYKNKINWRYIVIGVLVVTITTWFVTYPDPSKGIVSPWPIWLLPAIAASISSVILLWKKFKKAAPFAYSVGTFGVLIGADVLHLYELLNHPIQNNTPAVIGGAVVFDMVFITGILAVAIDGILMYKQRMREGFD